MQRLEVSGAVRPLEGSLGVKGLKWISRKWDVGMNWIDQAQNKEGWRAVINVVMNLRVQKNMANLLTS